MKQSENGKTAMDTCNYKINGKFLSFNNQKELHDLISALIKRGDKPLKVEPLDKYGRYFDHMQEIIDRGHEIISHVKGFVAIAFSIQDTGHFTNYSPCDISNLAYRCSELIQEIHELTEEADRVYEGQWKIENEMLKEVH